MLSHLELLFVWGIVALGLQYVSTNKDITKRILFKGQSCSKPPSVRHGSFHCTSSTHKAGSHCKLTCSSGYRPSNAHTTITCSSHLKWSTTATCEAIKCLMPYNVTNGEYKCPKSHHGLNQVCSLQCNPGYKPSSNSTDIRCLHSGTWSSPGRCEEIRCPYPANISHGVCSYKWPLYPNDVCRLHCKAGFKPRTSLTSITCLSSETWSASTDCVEVHCPVQTVAHGQLTCNGTIPYTRLDTCELSCERGFKPFNRKTVCLQNEKWSHNVTCEEITCPATPNVTNGQFYCAGGIPHEMDEICDLECDNGFKPSTHITHTQCLSTGLWSSSSTCVEITCPGPPNVTNGHLYCAGSGPFKQDAICDLQCDNGFKPSTHITHSQCLSTGQWSSSSSCVVITCPEPKPVANGRYACNHPPPFKQNDVCQLQCNHGYQKSSDLVAIVCLSSSTWSSRASCIAIKCYDPPVVPHGRYTCGNSTSYLIDTVCSLKCDKGYRPSPHSDISCLDEDDWSAPGTCEEIQCQDPPKVDNGQYHCSHSSVHSLDEVCHLQCNNGYRISSKPSEISCLLTGTWSSPVSCIEIVCPDPPKVDHGSYVCMDQGVHKLNDACQLRCDEGFKPIAGSDTIYCQMDSTWNKPSSCNEKKCDALPEVDHGMIICNSTVYPISTVCQIRCDPGYKASSLSDFVFCLEDETWTPVSCVGTHI